MTEATNLDGGVATAAAAAKEVFSNAATASLAAEEVFGAEGNSREIEDKMMAANKAARARRLKIVSRLIGGGFVIFVMGGALMQASNLVLELLGAIGASHGMFLMMLAIMSTDVKIIRFVGILAPLLFSYLLYNSFTYVREYALSRDDAMQLACSNSTRAETYCTVEAMRHSASCLTFVVTCLVLFYLSRPTTRSGRCAYMFPARIALARMWTTGFYCCAALSAILVGFFFVRLAFLTDDPSAINYQSTAQHAYQIVRSVIFVNLTILVRIRQRIRGLVTGKGADAEAASAAASVSAIIGATDPAAALAKAAQSFKAIRFDALCASDLDGNTAAVGLGEKAKKVPLGQTDFFMSHLPNLPTHMAGCKNLLILAGNTYVERLWTLLEIFMWTAMAKDATLMKLIVLEDEQVASRDDVIAKFRTCDVAQSACRNAEDKEKVVSIIEASFGELRLFDKMVTTTLLKATGDNVLRRISRASTGSLTKQPTRTTIDVEQPVVV